MRDQGRFIPRKDTHPRSTDIEPVRFAERLNRGDSVYVINGSAPVLSTHPDRIHVKKATVLKNSAEGEMTVRLWDNPLSRRKPRRGPTKTVSPRDLFTKQEARELFKTHSTDKTVDELVAERRTNTQLAVALIAGSLDRLVDDSIRAL